MLEVLTMITIAIVLVKQYYPERGLACKHVCWAQKHKALSTVKQYETTVALFCDFLTFVVLSWCEITKTCRFLPYMRPC